MESEAEPFDLNVLVVEVPLDTRLYVQLAIVMNLAMQCLILKVNEDCEATLLMMDTFMNLVHHVLLGGERAMPMRMHGHSIWRLPRSSAFADQALLGTFSEREFVRRFRVKPTTFFYICSLVAPVMITKKRGCGIALEKRVGISLNRHGTGNYLLGCGDLFGMSESLACVVVRQFCKAVLAIIRPLVVPRFTKEALPRLATQFEDKHGIPNIIGAIDGSHIPIIAPFGDPTPFYNRKGFYSALLQGIVDTETIFWDWDFGWAGSLHDYTLFVNSQEGLKTMAGEYLPYKLIGDATYPFRTSMYVPFKGSKEQLEPFKAHWNFIQSSTRMCVERAFGLLKGRWRIFLRRIEMKLCHIADVVGCCICLHNLCVMHKDFMDEAMVEDSKKWLQQEQLHSFGNLRKVGTMKIYEYGKKEITREVIDVEELIREAASAEDDDNLIIQVPNSRTVAALKVGVTMHVQLAKLLFAAQLRENVPLPEGFFLDGQESCSSEEHL